MNKLSEIKNIKASILICTIRPEPRLRLTLECLKNQTYKNFELLYIDALKPQRSQEFLNLLEEYRQYFPILHIQDKPWERMGSHPGIASARNTGLLHASGEAIIMTGDTTYFQHFWVERHTLAYINNFNSVSPRFIIGGLEGSEEDLSGEIEYLQQFKTGNLVKHPEHPFKANLKFGDRTYESPMDGKLPGLTDELIFGQGNWLQVPGGYMHSMSLQMSLDRLLNVNGFDERYDKEGYGFEDCDLGVRMVMMGFPQIMDPGNWVLQIHDKLNQRLVPIEEGQANRMLYDKLVENKGPIWVNQQFNLRKMRREF